MARALARTRLKAVQYVELVRVAIVTGCAGALIAAGQTLPI